MAEAQAIADPRLDEGTGAVDWRGVGIYLAITFGVTWTVEIAALAAGLRIDSAAATALLAAVMFVPALSAFVVRRFITREGFASAGLRRGPWPPYLAVWLGIPLLFVVVYALTTALGAGRLDLSGEAGMAQLAEMAGPGAMDQLPPPGTLMLITLIASLSVGWLITSVATFGEEFGWTGYLLPKLIPLGRWRAALLYGAIWGAWHAPIIVAGYNYPGYPVAGVAMMILFTSAIALLQAGLWLRSGSVLLTSFVHAGINSQARGIWPLVVVGVHPLLGGATGLIGITVLALAGAAMLRTAPRA